MHEVPVDRFRQSPPRPPAVVTVNVDGERNAMACEWNMPLSFDPPLIGVSIGETRETRVLLRNADYFGVTFLPSEQTWVYATVGACSHRLVEDKFDRFGIEVRLDDRTEVPLVVGGLNYVCRMKDTLLVGDHRLYVGEVVKAYASSEQRVLTPLHLGFGRYATDVNFVMRTIRSASAEELRQNAGVKVPGTDK